MGQAEAEARSSVRFSFGRQTSEDEIDRLVVLVEKAVGFVRGARA
jgi:cysteine sulfinate desulfinase/cysteine desulfurase-like protein